MSLLKTRAPWAIVLTLACFYSSAALADDKTLADLRKLIDESIAMIEAKSYEKLLERVISPQDREKMKDSFQEIVRTFAGEKAEKLLLALKAAKGMEPKLSDNGNTATYDVKTKDVDRPLTFQKVEGKWYIRN